MIKKLVIVFFASLFIFSCSSKSGSEAGKQDLAAIAGEEKLSKDELKENSNGIPGQDSINVSEKVVRAILSYTEYINANTWKK